MKTTRRGLLAGAVAIPAAAGLAGHEWKHGHGNVLVYDRGLADGHYRAALGRVWDRNALAIEGDPIRFAREVFAARPAFVRGITRQADAVLFEEVAQEAGYERAAIEIDGDALTWTMMPRIRVRG